MKSSSNITQDLNLIDLPLQGAFYTWVGRKEAMQALELTDIYSLQNGTKASKQ